MTLLCVLCLGSESNGPRLAMRTFSFTLLFHLQTKGSVPGKVSVKETYYSVKRDLLQCQKRPSTVSKETYYSVKRDLLQCQRDLLQCQKRPTTVSKETYYSVKRNLLQCQKRPTTVYLER